MHIIMRHAIQQANHSPIGINVKIYSVLRTATVYIHVINIQSHAYRAPIDHGYNPGFLDD